MWWRVISEPGLFAHIATPFYRNSPTLLPSQVSPPVCLSVCPHPMMMWSEAARQNNTSKEKQEAKPAEKVYRGSLHVAPVTRASKAHSVWCGFTEFHYHEILLCGCTGICVGVRIGVINRCAISVGMYIWCMAEGTYEQDVRSRRGVYCPTPPPVFTFKMANSIKCLQ